MSSYGLTSEGVEAVARFIAHGWARSEHALVLADDAHRTLIDTAMVELGADPRRARAEGRYVTRNAVEILPRFVHDGVLDPQQFRATMTALLAEAAGGGSHVRVYSELIALLWQRQHAPSAQELELQWRSLLRDGDFSLVCAYPAPDFADSRLVDVRRVCDLHTDLAAVDAVTKRADWTDRADGAEGIDGAEPAERSDRRGPVPLDGALTMGRYHACSLVYPPVPESVPAARHFVADAFRAWGMDDLNGDASIVVSELATNAVRHADSPFRVVLDRQLDGVRIGVEDADPDPLARRSPDSYDLGGRGVDIVEALSRRWGWSELPSGKLVWAELSDPAGLGGMAELVAGPDGAQIATSEAG